MEGHVHLEDGGQEREKTDVWIFDLADLDGD